MRPENLKMQRCISETLPEIFEFTISFNDPVRPNVGILCTFVFLLANQSEIADFFLNCIYRNLHKVDFIGIVGLQSAKRFVKSSHLLGGDHGYLYRIFL